MYLKEVQRVFEGSFKCVSKKIEGYSERHLKVILIQRVFLGSFKGVKGSFKKVSSVCLGKFQEMFQGFFNNVSLKFCFVILLLHSTHRSYPSRRRAC